MDFRNHILSYSLVLLIVVIGILSYFRFIVNHDYIVEYEGICDPVLEKCFVRYEEDGGSEEYYYFYIQKYAADLYAQCGKDITDCEEANICLSSDRECSITYCDETDGSICETLTEETKVQNEEQKSIEGESLQNIINDKNI